LFKNIQRGVGAIYRWEIFLCTDLEIKRHFDKHEGDLSFFNGRSILFWYFLKSALVWKRENKVADSLGELQSYLKSNL